MGPSKASSSVVNLQHLPMQEMAGIQLTAKELRSIESTIRYYAAERQKLERLLTGDNPKPDQTNQSQNVESKPAASSSPAATNEVFEPKGFKEEIFSRLESLERSQTDLQEQMKQSQIDLRTQMEQIISLLRGRTNS